MLCSKYINTGNYADQVQRTISVENFGPFTKIDVPSVVEQVTLRSLVGFAL